MEAYLKSFYNLAAGKTVIEGFDLTAEKSFKNILEKLENRKSAIEKRLI